MADRESAVPADLKQPVADNSEVDIRGAVLKFKELLSEDVTQLILFGSRARDDYKSDSDANVAVLLRGDFGDFVDMKLGLACLAYDALLLTGVRIRPFPVWKTEWNNPEQAVNSDILNRIAREGITVWQA